MSDLLALAERCEAASEGGFDLDNAILNALGYSWRGMGYWFRDDSHQWKGGKSFTTSIDAAMSLVPENCDCRWFSDDPSGTSWTLGEFTRGVVFERGKGVTAGHYALALCAAALRARAASTPSLNAEIAGMNQGDSA